MIHELDLHGVKHEEVDLLVENFVLLRKPPMRIITGNSDKMRKLVAKVLGRHGINWESFKSSQMTILKW